MDLCLAVWFFFFFRNCSMESGCQDHSASSRGWAWECWYAEKTRALSDLLDLIATHHITLAQPTWLKLGTYTKQRPNQGWRVKIASCFYFMYKGRLDYVAQKRRFFNFSGKEAWSREAPGSGRRCYGSWVFPHRAGGSQRLAQGTRNRASWVHFLSLSAP